MKRIVALLLAALLLVSLTACKAGKTEESEAPAPAADPVSEAASKAETAAQTEAKPEAEAQPEAQPEAPAVEAVVTPDELVGTWKLSPDNDLEQLETAFPGVTELGGVMEIGMDGLMFWTLGTSGGAGSFTVDGETVNAQIISDYNGAASPATCTFDPAGESFVMEYNGVTGIWGRD